MSEFSVIGKSVAMVDAAGKTTGAGKYTDDFSFPGMLVGKILHSPYPHARIKRIEFNRMTVKPMKTLDAIARAIGTNQVDAAIMPAAPAASKGGGSLHTGDRGPSTLRCGKGMVAPRASADRRGRRKSPARMRPLPQAAKLRSRVRFSWMLLPYAETVQNTVEGPDIDAAIGDREAAPVVPGRNLVPAGPQFFAGFEVVTSRSVRAVDDDLSAAPRIHHQWRVP